MFFNPYLSQGRGGGGGQWGARRGRVRGEAGGGAVSAGPHQHQQQQQQQQQNKKGFWQILPRGVLSEGRRGVIKNVCRQAPRMFYRDEQYLLSKSLRWPGVEPRPSPAAARRPEGEDAPLGFHLYEQAESVLFTDSPESLYPPFRRHLMPSGNVLRLFGVTAEGVGVCVNVFGQKSYFYCEYEDGELLRDLVYSVGEQVAEPRSPFSVSVEKVERLSVLGYATECRAQLYLVSLGNARMERKIGAELLARGLRLYETGVDPVTRFLIQRKVPSFGWCSVRRYHRRYGGAAVSSAALEVDCEVSDVCGVEGEAAWPVYRCLAFDIECLSESGSFPQAERQEDLVIQISAIAYETGGGGAEAAEAARVGRSYLFTLGPCAPIAGVDVFEFACEFELLYGFFLFFKAYEPEFLTGYNINAFDVPYLLTRMRHIYQLDCAVFTKLPGAGGRWSVYSPGGGRTFGAGAGAQGGPKVTVTGTVVLDMYPVCVAKTSAPNYKLNTVAEIYLQQQKDDLSYKEIPVYFLGSDEGRARVGRYCVQDAALVRDLWNRMNYHYEAAAVARLARLSLRRVVFEGQQVRIYTSLLEEAATRNMVLPSFPRDAAAGERPRAEEAAAAEAEEEEAAEQVVAEEEEMRAGEAGEAAAKVAAARGAGGGRGPAGYQGATVLEPDVGYYHTPVMVFDFASLYPSIIMAHNLCYSTLLLTPREELDETDVLTVTLPDGQVHRFVKEHVRMSILAELLTRWLTERKMVREEMKRCGDPVQRLLLDKKQLALKTTCNSFYGFTGTARGMLPCLAIAASVTSIGREMLMRTVDYVHRYFGDATFLRDRFGFTGDDFEEGDAGDGGGGGEEGSGEGGAMRVGAVLCEDTSSSSSWASSGTGSPGADGGPPGGAVRVRVIYGDTDSIFVHVRGVKTDSLLRRAEAMARDVTLALFRDPVRLEFEKIFGALMMICKKRYVGREVGGEKLTMKGVDLVRRTACAFVKDVVRGVLHDLFFDPATAAAASALSRMSMRDVYARGVPAGFAGVMRRLTEARDALHEGRVDLRELVLSCVLSKDVMQYRQANLPHLAVVKRLMARQEEVPAVGERVSYVLTAPRPGDGRRQVPNYELAEDPRYVAEQGLAICADRYFEQVLKSVTNALSPVFPKDLQRKDKFLRELLPLRVYLPPEFRPWAVRLDEDDEPRGEAGGTGDE